MWIHLREGRYVHGPYSFVFVTEFSSRYGHMDLPILLWNRSSQNMAIFVMFGIMVPPFKQCSATVWSLEFNLLVQVINVRYWNTGKSRVRLSERNTLFTFTAY